MERIGNVERIGNEKKSFLFFEGGKGKKVRAKGAKTFKKMTKRTNFEALRYETVYYFLGESY